MRQSANFVRYPIERGLENGDAILACVPVFCIKKARETFFVFSRAFCGLC